MSHDGQLQTFAPAKSVSITGTLNIFRCDSCILLLERQALRVAL
jgi:hypothetical protein